jgi:hypothetical protein
MTNNNPLRQYFRRPAVYVKLPSGGKDYQLNTIDMPENGELPVFPMTAIDEITARTPDALFNGTALVELVKSCIPNIKDPWQISSTDMDAVLIAIKAASTGDTLEIDTTCPKCQETSTYGVGLMPILSTLKAGNYDTPLEVGDLKIKLKPLRYKEMNEAALAQFELQRVFSTIDSIQSEDERNRISKEALEKITMLTMDLLSKTIEYIDTPSMKVEEKEFILDFLKNCDRATFINIRDYNATLKADTEIKPLKIKCSSCDNEYEQEFTLSPVDFFD